MGTIRTLCFPIKDGKILLGIKKGPFGKGKLNGYGGKVEDNETIEQATLREVQEECELIGKSGTLEKIVELTFIFPKKPEWNQIVYTYLLIDWIGEPKETDEMTSKWYNITNIPYDKMWDADKYWLPLILQKKKIRATFIFNTNNDTIKGHEIYELDKF